MSSSSDTNLFLTILMEEYKKKPTVDVVEVKRVKFQEMVSMACEDIKLKNYSKAKQSFLNIIEYMKSDPYPDELSCLMSPSPVDLTTGGLVEVLIDELLNNYREELLPKFLQVLFCFQREEWAMTMHWCNLVEMHEADMEQEVITIDLTATLVTSESEIKATAEVYRNKSFLNYWKQQIGRRFNKSKNERCEYLLSEIGNFVINKLMNLKSTFSDLDLHTIFHQNIIPLWYEFKENKTNHLYFDEEFISQCNECMEAKPKQPSPLVLRSYEDVKKLIVDYKTQDLTKRESSINKDDNLERKAKKHSTGQTQTDKIKCGSKSAQTEGVKCKNIEVQVNMEPQILNTLLDIKNKLVNQEKKDDRITKLTRRISELNDKATQELHKRASAEEKYLKKISTQECEIKNLKEQLKQCEKKLYQENEKNTSFQKLLVEQCSDKFNTQKNICKTFQRKATYMILYLKDILQFLTPNSIPSETVVKQNIDIWEMLLRQINENLDHLNTFYQKIRGDIIHSDKFNVNWPEIPDFPKDEDNIVFTTFKPAIKNIIDIEDKLIKKCNTSVQGQTSPSSHVAHNIHYSVQPQYPAHNSSFFMGPRLVYPTLPSPRSLSTPLGTLPTIVADPYSTFTGETHPFETPYQRQQSQVEQKPKPESYLRMSKSTESLNKPARKGTEISAKNAEKHEEDFSASAAISLSGLRNRREIYKVNTTASASATFSDSHRNNNDDYQEREKILFQYVYEKCPGATEDDVTMALLEVLDNKGTLSKMPKEKIVEDVRIILRMKKQPACVAPNSPHVDWEDDYSDNNCTICFEELCLHNSHTLPCRHVYHKECIKKWLKTSSICPICRVHSVINEELH